MTQVKNVVTLRKLLWEAFMMMRGCVMHGGILCDSSMRLLPCAQQKQDSLRWLSGAMRVPLIQHLHRLFTRCVTSPAGVGFVA